jgi:hypothetical protein
MHASLILLTKHYKSCTYWKTNATHPEFLMRQLEEVDKIEVI